MAAAWTGPARGRRLELVLLGRVLERRRRALAAADHLRNLVEVTRADERLVLHRRVTLPRLGRELAVLERGVRRHAGLAVAVRQLEHAQVQRMESGQGDELEGIAVAAERLLEARQSRRVQMLRPVERGRAAVGEDRAGEAGMD